MIYDLLKRMLEQNNYGTKESFQQKLDTLYALGRITDSQYQELCGELNSKPTV